MTTSTERNLIVILGAAQDGVLYRTDDEEDCIKAFHHFCKVYPNENVKRADQLSETAILTIEEING